MNHLEIAIEKALLTKGSTNEANKAYLEFIKANFIIPIEKRTSPELEPKVLYLEHEKFSFLPVFNNNNYFEKWADSIKNEIDVLKLTGVDLLKGVGEQVYICLNLGSESYKEFNPSEIARMRSIVLKIFK